MKRLSLLIMLLAGIQSPVWSAEYWIDSAQGKAQIRFAVKQLGISWLEGQFQQFSGEYTYYEHAPADSEIEVSIDIHSVTTNNNNIDAVIKGPDLLHAEKYPAASFKSSDFEVHDDEKATVTGVFSLHGVAKEISFPVEKVTSQDSGATGFAGQTTLKLADYDISFDLGPASPMIDVYLEIHGEQVEMPF